MYKRQVYVLYSIKFDKIYIGYTSNLEQRLISHNILATKGYTIKFRPWTILFTEEFNNISDALKREKELKSGVGRKYIWKLVKDRQT